MQINTGKWTLTIPHVSQHDEANYTCLVRNLHGLLQHTVFVEIIGILLSLSIASICYSDSNPVKS